MKLSFVVPGPPVPKARARVVNGHAHTPERTRQYERLVGLAASGGLALGRSPWSLGGRYRVEVYVTPKDARRFDIDNVAKAILDGCNRVTWNDDSQVDDLRVVRLSADKSQPRVEVVVEAIA